MNSDNHSRSPSYETFPGDIHLRRDGIYTCQRVYFSLGFKKREQSMRSRTDPYLMLLPMRNVEDAPKELLPYLATVRKASEWERLGFKVNLNEYGLPVRGGGDDYEFSVARERDEVVADAIKTGKKAVRHPLAVFEYVRAGCSLGDFANLPEDVAEYCKGNTLRLAGALEEALSHLHKAVTLNPNEVRYFEVYFPLRLQLGDLSAIHEELQYYEYDMDSAVHSGRFDEWLKMLMKAQEYELAKTVITATELALRDLVSGRITARLYGAQKSSWYEYKLEQFQKKAQKYLERIRKQESKKTPSERKVKISDGALSAADVNEVFYNFMQRCFIGEKNPGDVDLSYEDALFKRLAAGPITQVEAHQLPSGQRRVLRELLTQYIMFLEMNRQLPFPPDFLADSSQDELGRNLLEYVCHYRWPFPQMLSR